MGQTILIVDDNKFIVEGLHAILRRRGYQTVSALGGAEALALLSSSVPDLVLLDITMEPIDGWETLRRMRSCPGLESVPVIVFSARKTLSEEAACHQYNVSEVLAKPINTSRLLDAIEKVLNPGEGGAGTGAGDVAAVPGTGEGKPAPGVGESPPVAAVMETESSKVEASEGDVRAGSLSKHGDGRGEGAPGGAATVPASESEITEPAMPGGGEEAGGKPGEKPVAEQEIRGEDAKRKTLESRLREYHVSIGFEGHIPDQ
ncbi:MAG: response regulator [Methanolinea sp.]|nr:response regulator [Methanolinea sp.]